MRIMTYCSKNSIVPGGEKDFLQATCHQTPVKQKYTKKQKALGLINEDKGHVWKLIPHGLNIPNFQYP